LKFKEAIIPVVNSLQEFEFEILCVDDGNINNALSQLIEISRIDQRIRIIELFQNFGKEAAMTAWIDEAKGECIVPIDADLQDSPALIGKIFLTWQ